MRFVLIWVILINLNNFVFAQRNQLFPSDPMTVCEGDMVCFDSSKQTLVHAVRSNTFPSSLDCPKGSTDVSSMAGVDFKLLAGFMALWSLKECPKECYAKTNCSTNLHKKDPPYINFGRPEPIPCATTTCYRHCIC